jgi:hypothetical protein
MRIHGKPLPILAILSFALLLTIGFSPSVLAVGDRIPDVEGGVRLTDPELDEIRGGYAGVLFGMAYWLYVDSLGNQASEVSALTPTFTIHNGMIATQVDGSGLTITAGVGKFNDFRGIYHAVQASGDNLIINSTLVLQISLVTVKNQAAIPKLQGFTPW